jgi:hypothetical protein
MRTGFDADRAARWGLAAWVACPLGGAPLRRAAQLTALFSAAIELAQLLPQDREAHLSDALANTVGAATYLLAQIVRPLRTMG